MLAHTHDPFLTLTFILFAALTSATRSIQSSHHSPQQQHGGSQHLTSRGLGPPEPSEGYVEPEQRAEPLGYLAPPPGVQLIFQGPPVDLVALNRRRFELEHDHDGAPGKHALKGSQIIEAKIASLPDRLFAALPEALRRIVIDAVESETSDGSMAAENLNGASIERLTKSCLTVRASSTRPEQLDVTFHLYTRNNPYVPYIMRPQISREEMLQSSPLNPSKTIKWITHGFHTDVDKSEWMMDAKNKILAFEDSNVILTDWRRGASPALAFYPKAAANAHVVAKMIVKILRRLRQELDFSRVHLIGHSLGAHIMGFVGSAFTEEFLHNQQQVLMFRDRPTPDAGLWRDLLAPNELSSNWTSQLIGRITACDPALPCFGPSSRPPGHNNPAIVSKSSDFASISKESSQKRPGDWTPALWTHLRPDSAVVVEVIHSNPGVMGYADPLGDYDFYPNGFERQPGCGPQPSPELDLHLQQPNNNRRIRRRTLANSLVLPAPTGAHARSASTFAELIRPIKDFFQGYTCSHHRAVEYMVESMYYERIPQDKKLDRNFVCQLVGYQCADYASFKRGFCFRCANSLDCRALTTPVSSSQLTQKFSSSSRAQQFVGATKRAMPVFNNLNYKYRPQKKVAYFFDTRASKHYCIHHYHLLVKYRWARVREDMSLDGFQMMGTLASISRRLPISLHKYSPHSYTMLLTDSSFLGQIESLLFVGDKLKAKLVDYIEVTYMSNSDPRVRSLNSARLCRLNQSRSSNATTHLAASLIDSQVSDAELSSSSLFVRCSGLMV